MKVKFLIKKIHDLYAIRCPKCDEELLWVSSGGKRDNLECKRCKIYFEFNPKDKKKGVVIAEGYKEFIEDARKRFPVVIKESRIRTSDFYMPETLHKVCDWLKNKFQ